MMSDNQPFRLSVLIPVYNAAAWLPDQLEALTRQEWSQPWEIIIADNGSTDDSMTVVERYRGRLPHLQVMSAAERRGPAYALNLAAQRARGEALAFCDADDEIAPGWVAAMGEALQAHPFVACRFDIDKLNEGWVRQSRKNPQANDVQRYSPPFLPHAGGGGLGVRFHIFHEVGGFDETFTLLQDTDFCWKVQLKGYPLHFVPGAVLHVRYRASLRSVFRQARGYAEYNVKLIQRYRSHGLPSPDWREGIYIWRHLLLQVFRLRTKVDWAKWLWQFGYRVGRMQGSLKYRVLAL
jgi:glycosyltransferase involved in cell wall biosynthesis